MTKYFLSVSLIVFIWVFGYFNLFSIHLCYAPPPAHPNFEVDSHDISGSVQHVGALPDLGEPTTEGDNMAIGDEAGPTESYESPREVNNGVDNVGLTDLNEGPTDGSAGPTESYESPREGDNMAIGDEAGPTESYENPTDGRASPPELGESPAEMGAANGEALIDLYGPTPSTNTIYPTDIITNKKNHNGPIFSKLQLYNFLDEHHIPFNEQNYILNEFNELNQLSSISGNVSNDTSISKVITEPNHNQVFYGWYPVKGSNDTQYYILMFKLMAKHTSTNLSNTTSKENDYNYYYSLGVNGTGFNRHGFAYYNDTVIQYIGQNQILAKYPNKDNYYLTMNISSANNFLNTDIGRFPVVTK